MQNQSPFDGALVGGLVLLVVLAIGAIGNLIYNAWRNSKIEANRKYKAEVAIIFVIIAAVLVLGLVSYFKD
jgi:putative copper export protein